MNIHSHIKAPAKFEIIKKFVDLFLFGNTYAHHSDDGRFFISCELYDCLENNPKDFTKIDNNQDLLMLHFENTVTFFLEISTLQDRKDLFEWYKNNPSRAIENQIITIQRKNYSFQFRYFPLNLSEEYIEHSLVNMKIMPIQIFSLLANHLSRLDWYISLDRGGITVEKYKAVFNWILEYEEYSTSLMYATDGFLRYVTGKPRDSQHFKDESDIHTYLNRLKDIITRDYDEFLTPNIKTIEFKK